MSSKDHWNSINESNSAKSVSWYAAHLRASLRYVQRAAPRNHADIIDFGGGESTLVDDLLSEGYVGVTVLDISATALETTRRRVGPLAKYVTWKVADVLATEFQTAAYDVWHDRAVFHFLTTAAQRQRYVAQLLKALKPGGFAIVGTFGPNGPDQCSGLPVSRYDAEQLHGTFGEPFQLVDSCIEVHETPWGAPQQFTYCVCRRLAQCRPTGMPHAVAAVNDAVRPGGREAP